MPRRVEQRDLVGTWDLTPKSVDKLKRAGVSAPIQGNQQIVFRGGDNCLFQSYSDAAHGFITAEGTYQLEFGATHLASGNKVNVLEIDFGVLQETGEKAYQRLYFAERRHKLVLWHYLGDPDERVFIEYARRE